MPLQLNFTQQKDLEKLPEFNQDDASYENKLCKSHYAAEHYQKMGETSFNMKHFQNYEHLVHDLNLGNEEGGFFNSINMLPQDFFQRFRSLQTLQLKGSIFIQSLFVCQKFLNSIFINISRVFFVMNPKVSYSFSL